MPALPWRSSGSDHRPLRRGGCELVTPSHAAGEELWFSGLAVVLVGDPLPRREQLVLALSEPGSHVERLDLPGSEEARSEPQSQHEVKAAAGRLPPKSIRQTVRAHYGEFRKCYADGLARHADLRGAVTIRFVIGLDGAVSKVSVSDTDLPDCQVARCVRDAFSRIQFQKPDGGIVTVSYPVQLQPG